jgi:SAM-dependent methyltransferase
MAKVSACDVVLLDLPMAGLRIAAERAGREHILGACWAVLADAAILPFPDGTFDAVGHSDLLCCLKQKRAVLEACRRVVRDRGRMVFTVISVAPGLSLEEHKRAVENGPEYVEADGDYSTLLRESGWAEVERQDVTLDYVASYRRMLRENRKHRDALELIIGASEFSKREAGQKSELALIEDGLLCRELFVARPYRPRS